MSFSIKGYVLEPPRVGQSNSPFTITPNNFVSDSVAFGIAYPSDESQPRDDYLVLVTSEGDPPNNNGLLVNAKFGWTKNEVVQRFDYDAKGGRFRPLPGGPLAFAVDATTNKPGVLQVVGTGVPPATNVQLKVFPPLQVLAAAPFRVSVGIIGSGITMTVVLVATDAAFTPGGPLVPGTVELSVATGDLNWNTTDLTTFAGQGVRFQQQQFFAFTKSTGRVGVMGDPVILLNPIPGSGQFPLIRIGFQQYLQTVEVPNESFFTPPPVGTVQWAADTGRLHFNLVDVSANLGRGCYFDGVLFVRDVQLPRQSLGVVNTPSSIVGLPPPGGDLIFALPSATPYYQFPQVSLVTSFDPVGQKGIVQVNSTTGAVQFSTADKSAYGTQAVEIVFGDLPIEHGVSMRFFRCPVDLDAQTPDIKDVTALYAVQNAIWAKPIIGSPQVFLPSTPVDDVTLQVSVEQGTGTFTGTLNRLDVPAPTPGIGFVLDFDQGILQYAQRKNLQITPLLTPSGGLVLPDPLLVGANRTIELEVAPGTGVYTTLVEGVDILTDTVSGAVSFISAQGVVVTTGAFGSTNGTTAFTDLSVDFTTLPVLSGDYLEIVSGAPKGIYKIISVTATVLTLDTPAVTGTNLSYEILRGKEVLADRFFQPVQLVDPNTKVERIRALGSIHNATILVASGTATFPTGTSLNDPGTDFLVAGVQPGDTVILTSGPDANSARHVLAVAQHTLTVARTFTSFASGTYQIVRRLSIPAADSSTSRFRFGQTTFSTVVTTVATDSAFTAPGLLPAGTVQVSAETGNLNFSQADVTAGGLAYWVHLLLVNVDYTLQAGLGVVQFSDRLLSLEEVLVTYVPAPPVTSPPTPAGPAVQERGTFIVRKELTQPHPAPTSTLTFNPTGKTVALNPPQKVYRGGRPQTLTVQCNVDPVASTITFLPDSQVTNALPHGATVGPTENVYIDYFIYQAMGGEKNLTVLQPPMQTAVINITQGTNNFIVLSDQTPVFPAGYLLRIEGSEVFLIGSSVYNAGLNQTTVTLAGTQTFPDNFTAPKLYVSSGPLRTTSTLFFPSYFLTEIQPFDPIPRGINVFNVVGDRTPSYKTGTIVYFTDGLSSFTDFFQVSSSKFDPGTGKTTVTLNANALRQYVRGQQILNFSVRPIFEASTTSFQTAQLPILSQSFSLFRKVEGQVGVLQTSPAEYTVTDSGAVTVADPMLPLEEISVFYTGHEIVGAGVNVRSSYTCVIVPTDQNGLLGQVLQANYSIFSPDNFYYRVETLTNFKGEIAQELQAAATAGAPTSGPMTSNASTPTLSEQGRKSVFFDEGHLANEDIVARASLLFYNEAIDFLEDALQDMDGRVVGNHDGRFLFDGTTGAQHPPGPVANQIDDVIKISNAPYSVTFPPFAVISIGTFQKYYLPGPLSRFYPTLKNFFGVSAAGTNTGDEVLDTGSKNVTAISTLFTRLAWAVVTAPAAASATTLFVDDADGSATLARPPFENGMKCVIQKQDGTFINTEGSPVTVTVVSATQLTISGLAGAVPAGATIYRSPSDSSVQTGVNILTYYQQGRDYAFKGDSGQVTYIKPFPPLDGSVPAIDPGLRCHPIPSGQAISGALTLTTTTTDPFEFPALTGGTTDDDGDMSFPILSPSFACEFRTVGESPSTTNIGFLADESTLIPAIQAATTAPFVASGSLDVTKTIITKTGGGPFPSPIPKVNDLARILTGLNGATEFRRITAVNSPAGTITVDSPFTFQDSGFQYTITVSSTTVTGTATFPTSTTLQDLTATFLTSVQIGWTIVIQTGPNAELRRQVASITSNTVLVFTPALSSLVGGTYRVDNPLDTYGGITGDLLDQLVTAVTGEVGIYLTNAGPPLSEQGAINSYFSTVFDPIITSALGQTTATVATLTDATATFFTSQVTAADYVYIQSGADAGIYQVTNVISETQLQVDTPFPATLTNVSYQVVSVFGASKQSLLDLFTILQDIKVYTAAAQAFETLITTPVTVLKASIVDPTAFARGYLTTDFTARLLVLAARILSLGDLGNGPIGKIQNVLASTDRLYDKRFTWIDARINLQTGILVGETRAVDARIKAQADVLKQLTKLLAVEGS